MSNTIEQKVIFREILGKSSTFSHNLCEIILGLINVHILEMEDVLFHHNSAVMMPENPAGESSQDGTEDDATDPDDTTIRAGQEEVSGVKALALVFRQFEFDPTNKIVIAGHTDTSGEAEYNFKLSDLRAQSVLFLLTGEREKWAENSYKKHKVEDYQQILKYVFSSRRWPCNPGDIDDDWGTNTRQATESFISHYNSEYADKQNPPATHLSDHLVTTIQRDGAKRWPKELWGAVFDIYSEDLAKVLLEDRIKLDARRNNLLEDDEKWVDPEKKFVGCGESFPIDDSEKDNYRSQSNRRVVILFFDKDEVPVLDCPADIKKVHEEKDCPLWHSYHFLPLYIDPLDLYAVVYHMRFRYYNKVLKKSVDVPDGLKIQAFEENDKGVTEELQTATKYVKHGDTGVYYVKVSFKSPPDDGTHKKLHFEFRTVPDGDVKSKWVFTKDDKAEPVMVEELTDKIKKLPYKERYRYYDLPIRWSSRLYWTRYDGDMAKGDEFEKVFTQIKKFRPFGNNLTEPEKSLIFYLDDFVLTDSNFNPITQAVGIYEASILQTDFSVYNPDSSNHKSYYTKDGIKVEAGFQNIRIHIPDKRLGGVILKHSNPPAAYKLFAIFEDRVPAAHNLCGHRAAVYEHKEKCILVKRFQQRHQRDYHNIGRFDAYLLRDQNVSSTGTELSYIFNYFRWHLKGANPPNITQQWINTAITNITNAWNNKASNQLVSVYHKKDDTKYRIRIRYHIEQVPDADKETLVNVNPAGTGRSNMGRESGNIKINEHQPDPTTKRFTAAHEFGHATSLDDDYIERVNFCSFWRPGFVDFKLGGPFNLDENGMMKSNKVIRSRYYWHFASWMNKEFIKGQKPEFKVIKKNTRDFELPYNSANVFDPRDMAKDSNNYINWPFKHQRNTNNQKSTRDFKGKFHLYLYPLGKDDYSQGGLYGAKNFSAMLVLIVNLYFESWVGNPNTWAIYDRLNKINTAIDNKFRKNNGIKIKGSKPFEDTFVQVVPRFCVENYPADYTTSFPTVNNATFTARRNTALGKPEGTKHLVIKIVNGDTDFDDSTNPPELEIKNTNSELAKFWKYFSHTLGLGYGRTLSKDNFSVGNFIPGGTVDNL